MKAINHAESMAIPDAQRGKVIGGMPVLRDLEGPICAHCGSVRYFLVFRISGDGRNGILAGRCSYCRNSREFKADEIVRGF